MSVRGEKSVPLAPVSQDERYRAVDALRGVALFGVLLVNAETFFRISLFEHILVPHTHPGSDNWIIDVLIAWLFEFKAVTLFSVLFGVGATIQAERCEHHKVAPARFLLRRFAILLVIGIVHLFLISNIDILTLYAICGFLLVPLVRRPKCELIVIATILLAVSFSPVLNLVPAAELMHAYAVMAKQIYATGTFWQTLSFRWQETWQMIVPLLLNILPRTLSLMLVGVVLWRSDILKEPRRYRWQLLGTLCIAGTVGATSTSLLIGSRELGLAIPWKNAFEATSTIPLSLGMSAGLLLWLDSHKETVFARMLAAVGQLSLTNYLVQSVAFSYLFYGFGLGLFGKLGSLSTAFIAVGLFLCQLIFSSIWLERYRFGPVEWIWRSLTYGKPQRIHRAQIAPDEASF